MSNFKDDSSSLGMEPMFNIVFVSLCEQALNFEYQ
jgi:hypothetical protein